ncbi:MAG: MFS transporter [Polyangiaceae bacterium]
MRVGWAALFNDIATEMAYPLLPALLLALGSGAAALGWMEGVAESLSAMVKWWSGRKSDQGARKPLVVAGYAVASFTRPLLALVATPFQIIAVRALDRIGRGVRAAPRDAMVAASVPPERHGAAFGFERMMDNLGAVIGPIIAFSLAKAGVSLRVIFASTLLPGLVALFIVLGLREVVVTRGEAGAKARAFTPKAPALSGDVRRYLGIVCLFTLGASADSFLILRMLDLGLPVALVPIVWLSLNASKTALNVPGGKLADRFGKRRMLTIAWAVYAAAYALFALASTAASTWILIVFYGAYYGLSEGCEKALIAELATPTERGRAYGALHALTGFVVLPANMIFGYLYAKHVAWAFGTSALCAALATLALLASGVATTKVSRSE